MIVTQRESNFITLSYIGNYVILMQIQSIIFKLSFWYYNLRVYVFILIIYQNQSQRLMKILSLLFVSVLILTTVSQDSHERIQLDKPYEKELVDPPFMGRYIFEIDEEKVINLKSDKWFFFVELEPNQDKQWISTSIQLSVGKKDSQESTVVKNCDAIQGGVDSCFLTNKKFDYKTQTVHVKVRCRGPCKFKLSGEISTPFKLQPGNTIKMDFQDTAYSKVFTLDTNKKDNFDQLRIILRPQGFLQFPAPIRLYLNQGESIPSKQSHDMQGMTLWDNGQGIFLDMPDAKGTFTILVEGPEKNVLLLETQLVSFAQTIDLRENLPFFDYLGTQASKKYKVKVNPAKGVCFQMTTFSGAIKLVNIYDQNLQEIDEQFSPLFRTYSELQYQLDAQFFKKNQNAFKIDKYIIFEVQGVKESTFVVEPYELDPSISHLIAERTRYVELPSKAYHQYYIQIIELNSPQFKKSQFELILTTEENKQLKTRFFNCKKEHGKDCQLRNSEIASGAQGNKDLVEIQSSTAQHLNGVEIFKFSIPASKFTKVDTDVRKYIFTILIENPNKQEQLYTIQYIKTGKNIYLKEGEVKKDRIAIDEAKYYTFTNTNKDVQEIRVHIMEISGRVFMEGYLQDPRKKDLSGQEISDYHNSIRFKNVKENQTIYLKIEGKQNAYYSVQLQLMKQSQRQWWNRTHPNNGKGYNEIILIEDIAYEFNIPPLSKEVFQIHSNNQQFNLDVSSLLPLELCMTEQLKKAPFPPNCEVKDQILKNKIYEAKLQKGKIGNIGVTNNNEKEVKFNIRFTSSKSVKPIIENQTQSDLKCLPGILGKINKFKFKKDTSSCYTYLIEKAEDLQVVVDIISDQYDKVNILVELNHLEKVEIIGATHLFKKSQVQRVCEGNITECPLKIFVNSKIDTQIRFTAQFLSGTFYLLDGIANQFTGTAKPRNFVYELYNKINTTVILENKNGNYKFYGKVVQANSFWSEKTPTFPSQTDKIITSTNPFYFQYQISVLTQAQIRAAKCDECLLLISVIREKQTFNPNEKSKFVIECTQEDKFLKENQQVSSFLARRSMSFYQYYNNNNGSFLISINTQNQGCINAYVKYGVKNRASGSDFDVRSQASNRNRVIVDNAIQGEYSITLEAIEDCYYSIDVTSANQTFSTIQQGIYKDIAIDKKELLKFVYENNNDEDIKILTLHENGQITINAKAYPDIKTLIADTSKKTKYNWSGKDFLKISKDDQRYCTKCIYLIVITAERQTKSSIMIPSKDSDFPIVMDSSIKDELKKGEVESLRIFTQRITQFEINVHYGQVKIDIISANKNKTYFTKTFKESESTQYQNITISQDAGPVSDYTFMRYNKVKITAIKDSGFTFGFISNKDQSKRGNKVKYGVPQYVTLQAKKNHCLRGTLDDDKEQFLISITGDKQVNLMNNLMIQCTVNNTLLQLSKNIAKNQMIVTYNKAPPVLPAEYEFCMQSKEDIFLTFIHSSKLNYFPESQIIMVSKEMNLSFYAEGKNLIEINECTSRAITTISNSFNNMGGLNSEIKQVRKTNNIIQFNYYGPIFINIKADSATLLWRKKDELTKQGFGYDEYSSNKVRIDKEGDMLTVEIFPLKKIAEKPKVSLTSVSYTAFIAEEEMNLYDAMNCNNGQYLSSSISSNTEDKPLKLSFQVDKILKQFEKKKYVLIGILATATSSITGDQKYRFIYPYQQLLMLSLSEGNIKTHEDDVKPVVIPDKKAPKEPQSNAFNTFVLYFTLTVVLVFVAIWIYRKWIKRLLRKHKRQQLSQQGTGEVRYQEFTSYT